MSVTVEYVVPSSLCAGKKIKAGWELISVNGVEIRDVLDYQFQIKNEKLTLAFLTDEGKAKKIKLKKREGDDIGLEFKTYLMDKEERCTNKCIFCFIDQMPPGMRNSLYFKDDDSRLSFLFGNYITLTNLKDSDIDRIIRLHISPVNVSVHTMNPDLRVSMMKNRFAGSSLSMLKRLADAEIKLNAQLVLCPGVNDGEELEFSLSELGKLFPSIQSIACVPVGLTKYREKLPALRLYTPEEAKTVIETVDRFGEDFKKKHGTRLAFCADEFYISAKLQLPDEEYYEDYPQLENGVGLCASMESEFELALSDAEIDSMTGEISLATGVAAYPLIKRLAESAKKKLPNLKINVYAVENDFFGRSITVAGLITGKDLIEQLKGKKLGKTLLIPSVMLKADEDVFLDDVTLEQASDELGVKVVPVINDGGALFDAIINYGGENE